MNNVDLAHKTFGLLKVIEKTSQRKNGRVVWKCECECGNICYKTTHSLNTGTESCGCLTKSHMRKIQKEQIRPKNIKGLKFERLTAIEPTDRRSCTSIVWKCECKCGNICYVSANNLIKKNTQSCGCLNQEKLNEYRNRTYIDHTRENLLREIISGVKRKDNNSGITGVFFDSNKQKWIAYITFKGILYWLGSYDEKVDAVEARKTAENNMFGNFLEWYEKEHKI